MKKASSGKEERIMESNEKAAGFYELPMSKMIGATDELTDDDIEKVFRLIDKNQDGFLDEKEVNEALLMLNIATDNSQFDSLMSDLAFNGRESEEIKLRNFRLFVRRREKALRELFDQIDADEDGKLSHSELLTSLRTLGLKVTEEEVERMIGEMDVDGDGQVDFGEFKRLSLFFPRLSAEEFFVAWRDSSLHKLDLGDSSGLPPPLPQKDIVVWNVIASGGIAGAVSRTSTAPFDRLKVLMQAGGKVNDVKVTGVVQGISLIYRENGLRGFWRGNMANCVKIVPESAAKFFAYEKITSVISKDSSSLGVMERFVAGALAGVVSQSVIYPMEITKTRLAVAPTGTYRGIVDCLRTIVATEGTRSLFKGITPSLMGIVPYAGTDLSVYFTLKERWKKRNPGKESPGVLTTLSMGAFSSFCGQTLAYPLQLMRTRMQSHVGKDSPSLAKTFKNVVKDDGVGGLWRGIGPNFMKAIPAIAISYVVYEKSSMILKKASV